MKKEIISEGGKYMSVNDLVVKGRTEEKSYSIKLVRRYLDNDGHMNKEKETRIYKRLKKARVGSTPRIDMEELM
jgi:hypothetical protein